MKKFSSLLLVLTLFLSGCNAASNSSNSEKASDLSENYQIATPSKDISTTDICQLFTPEELKQVLGGEVKVTNDSQNGNPACIFDTEPSGPYINVVVRSISGPSEGEEWLKGSTTSFDWDTTSAKKREDVPGLGIKAVYSGSTPYAVYTYNDHLYILVSLPGSAKDIDIAKFFAERIYSNL